MAICDLIKILFLAQQTISNQVLFYNGFNDDFTTSDEWKILNYNNSFISYCDTDKILGGFEQFSKQTVVMRMFQLPPHSSIQVTLSLYRISTWDDTSLFRITIDGDLIYNEALNQCNDGVSIACDSNTSGYPLDIEIDNPHNFNTLLITLSAAMRAASSNLQYWGFRNFRLSYEPCPKGCYICEQGDTRQDCFQWIQIYSKMTELTIDSFQSDGWQVNDGSQEKQQCASIPLLCSANECGSGTNIISQIQSITNNGIKFQFRFFKIDSWDFEDNETAKFYLNNQLIWSNIYQKNVDYYSSLCGDSRWFDLGFNIQVNVIDSQLMMYVEFNTTLDQAFSDESFGIRDFYIYAKCLMQDQQCQNICGDMKISEFEQCDDGNIQPFDGCFNCQYSCVDGCYNCIKGICFQCFDTYEFDEVTNQCLKLDIFNQQIIEYQYNLTNLSDYCAENCDICFDIYQCLKCRDNYNMILGYCQQICGSDDDSIYNYCQTCGVGICEQCYQGYNLEQQICTPICGDSIIVDQEECDDGNDEQYDGCYLCIYSCPLNCDICEDGVCQQCLSGYELNTIYNKCNSICGDGIVISKYEECDDYNNISGDGCSYQCKIENNWICIIDSSSTECYYHQQPIFYLEYQMQSNQYQYVLLKANEPLKQIGSDDFITKINSSIFSIDQDNYEILIKGIQNVSDELSDIQYLIQIEIKQNLNFNPYLQITLEEQLYDSYNASLENLNAQIQLQQPFYLTEQQKYYANQITDLSQNAIIVFGTMSASMLLFGSGMCFWSMLEILQEQQYLKYINVVFPENLMIFFNNSFSISLNYVFELQYPKQFTFQYSYYESTEKFEYYQINTNIISNLRGIIISYFSLFFMYIFICQCLKIFINLDKRQYFDNCYFLANSINKQKFKLLSSKNDILKDGIQQLNNANTWEIYFIIFLQLQYNLKSGIQNYFSLFLALGSLFIGLITIAIQFVGLSSWKHFSFEQFWDSKLKCIIYIKKLLFMAILVFFQSSNISQIFFLGFINIIYLILYLFFKSKEEKKSVIKYTLLETSSSFFIISSIIHTQEASQFTDYQFRIIIGWIQLFSFILVFLVAIILDIHEQIIILYNFIQSIIKQMQIKNTAKVNNEQIEQKQQSIQITTNTNKIIYRNIFVI